MDEPISLLSSDDDGEPVSTKLAKKDREIEKQNREVSRVEAFVKTYENLLIENVARLEREMKRKETLLNDKQRLLEMAATRSCSSQTFTYKHNHRPSSSTSSRVIERTVKKEQDIIMSEPTGSKALPTQEIVMKATPSPIPVLAPPSVTSVSSSSQTNDQVLRVIQVKPDPDGQPEVSSSPKFLQSESLHPLAGEDHTRSASPDSTNPPSTALSLPMSINIPSTSASSIDRSRINTVDLMPQACNDDKPSMIKKEEESACESSGDLQTKKGRRYGPFSMESSASSSSGSEDTKAPVKIKPSSPAPRKRPRLYRKVDRQLSTFSFSESVPNDGGIFSSENEWEGPLMEPAAAKRRPKGLSTTDRGKAKLLQNIYDDDEKLSLPLQEMIDQQPGLEASLDFPDEPLTFSRVYISAVVGGQPQGTWPTPNKEGGFPYWIGDYVCLNRDLNTMMPDKPGAKGCVFLCGTNGGEPDKEYPLFIKKSGNEWGYYGTYKLSKVYQVPLKEWHSLLTEDNKARWSQHLLEQYRIPLQNIALQNWLIVDNRQWGIKKLIKKGLFTESELRTMKPKKSWPKVLECFTREDDDKPHLRLLVRLMQPVDYDKKLASILVERYPAWQEEKRRSLQKPGGRSSKKKTPSKRLWVDSSDGVEIDGDDI